MMPERDLVEMIKTQIRLERKTTKKIKEIENVISNLAAKLFLAEMRFDTEKHAKILQTILNLMDQIEPNSQSKKFWQIETREYVDALVIKKILEDHIKVEIEMLKKIEEVIKKTDDPALKLLFTHIIDDERKHHRIMETILQRAFKMISIT